jgi:hypothetical protein
MCGYSRSALTFSGERLSLNKILGIRRYGFLPNTSGRATSIAFPSFPGTLKGIVTNATAVRARGN